MPLGRSDADRGLDLLWEFHRAAESEEERAAYAEAIASLHSYLTDLLPASQPSLRARAKEGFVDVRPTLGTGLKVVEIRCRREERLGISIDSVNVSKQANYGDLSPFVVSLVEPGCAAAKEGSLQHGDQLVEVDGHPLARATLERARLLLDSAERRGYVKLLTVPLGLLDGMKHSVSRQDLYSITIEDNASSAGRTDAEKRRWGWRTGRGGRSSEQPAVMLQELQQTQNEVTDQSFEGQPSEQSDEMRESRMSLTQSEISRNSSTRSSTIFKRRKVRKMHIMKGAQGLGLRIIGGKGSKHGNIGIFIRDVNENGAAYDDGRLKPGDELLMVDGKSLVGLTHSEAVNVLKTTKQLVQLVVATYVSDDQSITSSMASIPDWAKNHSSAGPPPLFGSSTPQSASYLSTGFAEEGGLEFISPEFTSSPQHLTFKGGSSPARESMEMRGFDQLTKRKLPPMDGVHETTFDSSSPQLLPAKKAQKLSHEGEEDEELTVEEEEGVEHVEIEIELEKKEGKGLGFTVCGGNDSLRGIFIRAIDPTGVAGREGSLLVDDQLLEANSCRLSGLSHKQSARLIRGLKPGKVILRVRRKMTRRSQSEAASEGSTTDMEGSVTGSVERETETHSQGIGPAETIEFLGRPPLQPPPQPPSGSDTEQEEEDDEGSVSLPPTPPASVPPHSQLPGPPLPTDSSSLLSSTGQKDDSIVKDEFGEDGGVRGKEEEGEQDELIGAKASSSLPVGVVSGYNNTEIWVGASQSDSEEEQQEETWVERRIVKQILSTPAKQTSSDIQISGALADRDLPGFTETVQQVEDDSTHKPSPEEQGTSSESSPYPPTRTQATSGTKLNNDEAGTAIEREGHEEEEEREGELPLGFQKFVLQMKKRAKGGLGVTIIQSTGKTRGLYMVRRIMAGGVAARDKRIKAGDRLVAINGKNLRNLSHSEVLKTINDTAKDIHLEIWRDPEFEFDASSSIYSIGSRSSIISDDESEDSSSKFSGLERFIAREGARGARASPQIARYSASMADSILSQGTPSPGTQKRWSAAAFSQGRPSPGTQKRWSTIVFSPNVGPAGEILSSPSPPTLSPSQTFDTPLNPIPSPTSFTPSPIPPSSSLSPSPEPTTTGPASTPPLSPPLPSPPTLASFDWQDSQNSDRSSTPPPPLPASAPPPPPSVQTPSQLEEDTVFSEREVERPKSLGPVPKGARLEHGPFEIEFSKGIFSLGLTIGMGSVGMIVIKSLASRSPIKKDGNIRVGDHLLSVNDDSLIGVDVETAEGMIKALPRGVVRFVAMAPPKDVTGGGLKGGVPVKEEVPQKLSTNPPSRAPPPPPPPPESPLPEAVEIEEPGIVKAKVQRFGSSPVGLKIEGGSESQLKYIFVESIEFGSAAFNCGKFQKGDQLVMVGRECLIGMSLQQAQEVLNDAPLLVEIVAQRKESVKQSPPLVPKSEVGKYTIVAPTLEEQEESNIRKETRREDIQEFVEDFSQLLPSVPPPKKAGSTTLQRSSSQSDVWLTDTVGAGMTTSLGYAAAPTSLNSSFNMSRQAPAGSTQRSKVPSVENLRDFSDSGSYQPLAGSLQVPNYYAEAPLDKPAEELIVVELHREASGHKLGLGIVGGADNPRLPEVHVKKVIADGLVFRDGRIKRGDRIISVNGRLFAGLTNKEALQILKESGDTVKMEVAQRVSQRSQAPSPFQSLLQSRQSSGENTNEPPSPVPGVSRQRSRRNSGPPTPPGTSGRNTLRGRSRRVSLSQEEDEESLGPSSRLKPATMPRKLKSIEGVKIVELLKGPTGLGMNLKGGTDENLPIIVREVFPGGVAHKSGKIFPGDVIIEVNNDSFENLTHKEALQKLKSYPQGKISLLVRDRIATLPRKKKHISEHT